MRQRHVRIANELAVDVMTTGWQTGGIGVRCVAGLPEDARLVNAYLAKPNWPGPKDLVLVFESDIWPARDDISQFIPTYETMNEATREEC